MDPLLPSATSTTFVVGEANGGSKYVRLKAELLGKSSSYRFDEDLKKDENDKDPFVDNIPKDRKDGLIICQWESLFFIIVALACTVLIPSSRRYQVWNIHIWKCLLIVLVIICGHLLSGLLVGLMAYVLEHKYIQTYLYFVYGVRNAIQNCLWNTIVLLVWYGS